MPPPMIIAQPLAESTPATARPSDYQFRKVARRLSRLIPDDGPLFEEEPTPIAPQMTGPSIQPQMTGASVMSEYTNRVVTDLKTQFDEVQNLRRDLGIMRQLYTEFMKQTKDSLGALRAQTQTVRQLASQQVGGARAYIDTGKAKLDTRSSNVLTKMEELQDTVENIKDDVLKRNVSPKAFLLKQVRGDIDAVAAELQSLRDHIQTVKPMWKKTWEEELQNIVEELLLQVEQAEAEIETLQGGGKKKNKSGGAAAERLETLEHLNERRKWHISRLEIILRLLDNGSMPTEKVVGLKEDVQYFVESNTVRASPRFRLHV